MSKIYTHRPHPSEGTILLIKMVAMDTSTKSTPKVAMSLKEKNTGQTKGLSSGFTLSKPGTVLEKLLVAKKLKKPGSGRAWTRFPSSLVNFGRTKI
jgi:hypothetical protein